ncbi:MAG: hypothetical protein CSA66_05030 [Proteobacteria bacterium]|nr:MAG: hypothetical protein CSA66_05030 [Pseudomonadota bacterium]
MPTTLDGRYRLDAEVEALWYGVVYAGRDLDSGDAIAVTVVHPEFMVGPGAEVALARLAQSTRFSHPNLATVRWVAAEADPVYVVSDAAIGEPLALWRHRAGRVGVDVVYRVMGQLIDAVERIHERGLHGALSPATVRIAGGHAWLMNPWHLAPPASLPPGELPPLRTAWLAPEQLYDVAPEGPATDVYALGLMLGYLLACGLTEPGHSLLIQGIDVPPQVDEVYVRATAHHAELRYAGPAELRAALVAAGGAGWRDAQVAIASSLADPTWEVPEGATVEAVLVDAGAGQERRATDPELRADELFGALVDGVDATVEEEAIPASSPICRPVDDGVAVTVATGEVLGVEAAVPGPPPLPPGAMPEPPPVEDREPEAQDPLSEVPPDAPTVTGMAAFSLPGEDDAEPVSEPRNQPLLSSPVSDEPAGEVTALSVAALANDTCPTAADAATVMVEAEAVVLPPPLSFDADGGDPDATGGVAEPELIEHGPAAPPPRLLVGGVVVAPPPRADVEVSLTAEAGADDAEQAPDLHASEIPDVGPRRGAARRALVQTADFGTPEVVDDVDTGERLAVASGGAGFAVDAATLSSAVRNRRSIDSVIAKAPAAPAPADAAAAVAGGGAAVAVAGGGAAAAEAGGGAAAAVAGAPPPEQERERRWAVWLAAILFLIAGGVAAVLLFGPSDGGELGPGDRVVRGGGARGGGAVTASGVDAGRAPGADAESVGALGAGTMADAAQTAQGSDDVGPEGDVATASASAAGAEVAAQGAVVSADAQVGAAMTDTRVAQPSGAAAVAASVDAGEVTDAGAAVDDDAVEVAGAGAAAGAADSAVDEPPPAYVPLDWRKLRCPGGMAKVRKSYKKTLADGREVKDYKVHCVDRYEYPGAGQVPRTNVSLAEAKSLCAARGARLCSRVEWRRGCGAKYPYGRSYSPSACNTVGEDGMPRPVKPSGAKGNCKGMWGTFDMVGNVAEWTQDGYVNGGSAYKHGESATCFKASRRVGGHKYVGFRCCADAR